MALRAWNALPGNRPSHTHGIAVDGGMEILEAPCVAGGGAKLGFDKGIYEALKTIHILAAIVWLGGGVSIHTTTPPRWANGTPG